MLIFSAFLQLSTPITTMVVGSWIGFQELAVWPALRQGVFITATIVTVDGLSTSLLALCSVQGDGPLAYYRDQN